MKIQAGDYFTREGSPFKATVVSGSPNHSAKSSLVIYDIKCSKCKESYQRRGNQKTLNTCANCKHVWEEADTAPVVVQGGADEIPDDAPTPARQTRAQKRKADAEKDLEHLVNIAKGEAEPRPRVKAKEEPIYYVEEILDYYDDRVDNYWHRFYYVKWQGDDKLTFVRDDAFDDHTMVDNFEAELEPAKRLAVLFKDRSRVYKSKHAQIRKRRDVLDEEELEAEVEAEAEAEEEYYEVIISKVIRVKKGTTYEAPDGFTYKVVEKK